MGTRVKFSTKFERALADAPRSTQRKFDRQLGFLLNDIKHPSLRAKKYDKTQGIWQARVDRNWRFYFIIDNDAYYLIDIIPHPK